MEFLSIISVPRYAVGKCASLQRAAIESWTSLRPRPQIILLGNEVGIRELADQSDALHVPHVSHNVWGTPLLSDTLKKGAEVAQGQYVALISSDLQINPSFMQALYALREHPTPFLLSGKSKGANNETLSKPRYFVFPRSLLSSTFQASRVPPLALGRPCAAEWLLTQALHNRIALIDGTEAILSTHPFHDTRHTKWGTRERMERGAEAELNRSFAKEIALHSDWLSLATYKLTATFEVASTTASGLFENLRRGVEDARKNSSFVLSQHLIDEALRAEKFGLAERALELLDYASKFAPQFPGIGVAQSLCYRRLGLYAQAREALRTESMVPELCESVKQMLMFIDEEESRTKGI